MTNEAERMPFAAADLPGRRWLVIAPHPDDEILGPGGALAKATRAGVDVRVVIVTDGAAGGDGADLAATRAAESRAAAEILGLPEPTFLGLPDRGLEADRSRLAAALANVWREAAPDLILAPSPLELHPDHRAVAEVILGAASGGRIGEPDFEAIRHAQLAFYEVATAMPCPNRLVDVGATAALKQSAASAFRSQKRHDYAGVAEALGRFRRLTLAPEIAAAEAFWVIPVADVAKFGVAGVRRDLGGTATVAAGGVEPLSVVVRTRDRPGLLRQALESLAAGSLPPAKTIVVNDGGVPVADIVAELAPRLAIELIEFTTSRGRVAAANAGAERVATGWFGFLDDDDLVLADHVETLGRALRSTGASVVYTDAATAIYRRQGEGWACAERHLDLSHDFDAALLRLFNYLPLHTVAIPTALWRELGGFDARLDLSEDWDFLIRLARRTPFAHVRRVTCEYRVFEGAGAPAHAPAGSAGFLAAREALYRRHGVLDDPSALAQAVDTLRREAAELVNRNWQATGAVRQLESTAAEWQRQVEAARREFDRRGAERQALEGERDGYRIALEQALAAAAAERADAGRERLAIEAERDHWRAEVDRQAALAAARADTEAMLREQLTKDARHLEATYVEIARLGDILRRMEGTKAWRLHRLVERAKGRS